MEIRAEEITRLIKEQLGSLASGVDVAETGVVDQHEVGGLRAPAARPTRLGMSSINFHPSETR